MAQTYGLENGESRFFRNGMSAGHIFLHSDGISSSAGVINHFRKTGDDAIA